MNYLAIAWNALIGLVKPGTTAGVEISGYVIRVAAEALGRMKDPRKENIVKCFSILIKCLSWLKKIERFIPLKWRDEFTTVIDTLDALIIAFVDFKVTDEEFAIIRSRYELACKAWCEDDEKPAEEAAKDDTDK